MKHTSLFLAGAVTIGALVSLVSVLPASAAVQSMVFNGHTYYKVNAADPNMNTGNKVCAAVAKACIGYTAGNVNVCKMFHPTASVLTSVNGSKSAFYCDGAPQQGIACANRK